MTGTLLPFARPAPHEEEPEATLVTRERTAAPGLSFTLTIGHEAIARELAHRGPPPTWSPPDDLDLTDADGFLYADDDGPD